MRRQERVALRAADAAEGRRTRRFIAWGVCDAKAGARSAPRSGRGRRPPGREGSSWIEPATQPGGCGGLRPRDSYRRLDNARVRQDLRDVLGVLRFLTVGHGERQSVISGANGTKRQHDRVSYEPPGSLAAPVDAERNSLWVDTGSFVRGSRDRAAVADDT